MERYLFQQAKPIWAAGRQTEWNLHLGFRTSLRGKCDAILALTCSSTYQVFVNGVYVAYGPARAAGGYYRVDELALKDYLTEGINTIAIHVAAYNIGSYALLDQPGFLTAELICCGTVQAATGICGFECLELKEYTKKVQRFSYQRCFLEDLTLTPHTNDWQTGGEITSVTVEECSEKCYLTRGVDEACYSVLPVQRRIVSGSHTPCVPEKYRRPWHLNVKEPSYKQYKEEELEIITSEEIQRIAYHKEDTVVSAPSASELLSAGRFAAYTFGRDATGMIRFHASCKVPTTFYIMFDETLRDGLVDPLRFSCIAATRFRLAPGEYDRIFFEPITAQYVSIVIMEGEMEISGLSMVEYKFHEVSNPLNTTDPVLQKIYDAAVETFRQNTLDIYMDCPSRERAGWLCDSFFTSRVEYCLTGKSKVERNFLENFMLADHVPNIPDGMFPMCYPSDFPATSFIPNWAMWLVLELEEYQARTGDRAFVNDFRGKIYALADYFRPYENADGLLESLPGWIFVEWSKCNELVQDVNFPTNMLYASMLDAISRLYGDSAASQKATAIRQKVRELSYNGEFFTDRLVKKDGKLVSDGEVTETCQYYAFFTQIATPETYPELWHTLLTSFGPDRTKKGLYPNVWPSNAFIGNYLRLELLSRYGKEEELLKEISGYFEYMADRTGTLWENIGDNASMNHGFASHVAVWLDKIFNR